ncbi:Polyphosphate kinase [Marinilactibacillus psychrotolerans 42ea]|uniref:Polyphosphate kinase n=1 Tax=Marinilactibacillus psychrotolerans 42ea TaxID=1255609 RepID=A0A1R4KB34_9LACT|nr:RNA degradosome polyphosphate kinase [Marinilactibacillus psychrotolerans]SJN41517.1 Polyphosphate kinase [Marinilactibacillus psychrotolerans 42ea]
MQHQSIDLHNPIYYQNRELSWLDFNERVLAEAEDPTNPLLEKLEFLSIGSSNSDEFFKVRVAGLQDQLRLGVKDPDSKKQWSPEKQLDVISKKNKTIVRYQYDLYDQNLKELAKKNVLFKHIEDLDESSLRQAKNIFRNHIKPAITPFGVDAYRPFPHLNDEVIHLFVRLKKSGSPFIAILPVPLLIERFHILEEKDTKVVLFTEEILFKFLNELFIGYEVEYSFTFRITRNADLELQEEGAEDLLSVIEDYLLKRKNGRAVRLEVDVRTASSTFKEDVTYLMEELDLLERDVYEISGPLDLTVLSNIASELKTFITTEAFQNFTPKYPNILNKQNIFELSEKQDIFLHHPFDSFQPVIDLVRQAVEDPNTIAIKQTLYRVSDTSPFIEALKKAARKDIQVTVLVELKARFDEANNVHWARELEESGAHILYGIKNLKTHSKATLIVKKDHRGFKRYAHLGTGNYNEQTAKLYTDMGVITTNKKLTQDVAAFFNYLSGYSEQPTYNYLHVSPFEMRDSFIDNIEMEITLHKQYGNGHIIAKMNSLTDKKMIIKLFEASQAGVKVDLIIRGICCLIPGIPGVSENIQVHSIIGRFLEHSRVYYFYQNGNEELYLSSADMMTRNMIKRVELAFPILDGPWKKYVINILKFYMYDNTKAWELEPNGRYTKKLANSDNPVGSQQLLMNHF